MNKIVIGLVIAIVTAHAVAQEQAVVQVHAVQTAKQKSPAELWLDSKQSLQKVWDKMFQMDKIRQIEKLGEEGAIKWAELNNLQVMYSGANKICAQGPDIIVKTQTGEYFVIEAKGGWSPLKTGYGFKQGSAEWGVMSTKRLQDEADYLLSQKNLSPDKFKAAQEVRAATEGVFKTAADGKFKVITSRTLHLSGMPTSTFPEQIVVSTPESIKLARSLQTTSRFEKWLIANPAAARFMSKTTIFFTKAKHIAVKTGNVIGKVIKTLSWAAAGCIAYASYTEFERIEEDYMAGRIDEKTMVAAHARNTINTMYELTTTVGIVLAWKCSKPIAAILATAVITIESCDWREPMVEKIASLLNNDCVVAIGQGGRWVGYTCKKGTMYVRDGVEWVALQSAEGAAWAWDGSKFVIAKVADGAVLTWDGAQWVAGKVADGSVWMVGKIGNVAAQTWDGTKWVAGKVADGTVEGAKRVVGGVAQTWDGTKWVGGKVADGAVEGAKRVVDGVAQTWDGTKWVGGKVADSVSEAKQKTTNMANEIWNWAWNSVKTQE